MTLHSLDIYSDVLRPNVCHSSAVSGVFIICIDGDVNSVSSACCLLVHLMLNKLIVILRQQTEVCLLES